MIAAFRPIPSKEELERVFHYDPATGMLLKRDKDGKPIETGFRRSRRGGQPWMICVSCNGIQYAAHRVIWTLMTGKDPAPLTIDHIDRNPFNNKWSNLRLADSFLQSQNREWKTTKEHKGISFHNVTQKWQARKTIKGKRVYLGVYDTKEQAIEAVNRYENEQSLSSAAVQS